MPELRHLRYFVAVAEELNFSRAAKRLRMAQPPLSVAIRQLEDAIGAPLFARTTREVNLTDAGHVLLDGARRTLAEADAAVVATRRVASGELGEVTIGHSWTALFKTLPTIAKEFRRVFPAVEITSREMQNGRMLAALRERSVDVAISINPELSGDFTYKQIRSERVVAVLAADHPLADSSGVTLADLRDEEFFMFQRQAGPRHYDFFIALFNAAGFDPKVRHVSFHTRWALGTWDASAVALLPESVVNVLPEGLAAVPIESPSAHLDTFLLWRPDDDRTVLSAFAEAAHRAFETPSKQRQPRPRRAAA
jgi:DNA-binding transcriptional LysR family regulator